VSALSPLEFGELSRDIARMRSYFPFRIVWGYVDDGHPIVFAHHTRRQMNAAIRAGKAVYTQSETAPEKKGGAL